MTEGLSSEARYARLLASVRRAVPYDSAVLHGAAAGGWVVVASEGFAQNLRGQHFEQGAHPRLDAIVAAQGPVRFAPDDPRPDPLRGEQALTGPTGWLGFRLAAGAQTLGIITLHAAAPRTFDAVADSTIESVAALTAAALRAAGVIEDLKHLAEHRGRVAEALVHEALERDGGRLLGQSAAMNVLRAELSTIADTDVTALITGETGVGKELVARTLHAQSSRRRQPLVHVNCAALNESVAESELFGHVRGAFTGAHEARAGKFELADGGTLFLDEIGEMPLSVQPKLLRALQFGEIQRVGADESLRADVRVIAATNRDLAQAVKSGQFRADLYHRLAVFPIYVPPLCDRDGDVVMLAEQMLERARRRLDIAEIRFTVRARRALARARWPGNVRELEHAVLRAAMRASEGRPRPPIAVDAHHLTPGDPALSPTTLPVADTRLSLADATAAFQRSYVRDVLTACDGNWAEAARRLDVDRSNLHRLGRRLQLK